VLSFRGILGLSRVHVATAANHLIAAGNDDASRDLTTVLSPLENLQLGCYNFRVFRKTKKSFEKAKKS